MKIKALTLQAYCGKFTEQILLPDKNITKSKIMVDG